MCAPGVDTVSTQGARLVRRSVDGLNFSRPDRRRSLSTAPPTRKRWRSLQRLAFPCNTTVTRVRGSRGRDWPFSCPYLFPRQLPPTSDTKSRPPVGHLTIGFIANRGLPADRGRRVRASGRSAARKRSLFIAASVRKLGPCDDRPPWGANPGCLDERTWIGSDTSVTGEGMGGGAPAPPEEPRV